MARFAEEAQALRPLPERGFEPRLAVPLTIDRRSLVRYRGETYSVPAHWKVVPQVTAYMGPCDIRFIWRDEVVMRPRAQRHERHICYTDYLTELKEKPQAVRQVAPELTAALGEPFVQLWTLLEKTYGGKEAGRLLARVLEAVVAHGAGPVGQALHKALQSGGRHLLDLAALTQTPRVVSVAVPEPLADIIVESARASDFDHLLEVAS
jgi:hypothetical protein